MKAGRNVYLTGPAGSGKTHVLNKYVEYLQERGVVAAVTASTGIAATHIDGVTIHSWSGIGIKDDLSDYEIEFLTQKERLWKRYDKTKTLVIDEISMLHPRMFDALDRLAQKMKGNSKPFGGMQVVLSGDFFQLPPITKNGDHGYADSSNAWGNMGIRVCYLETQFRTDDVTLEGILSEIRSSSVSTSTQEFFEDIIGIRRKRKFDVTRLYTHNIDVDAVNERELDALSGEEKTYEMRTSGRANLVASLVKSILAPETLRLKIDAVVMFVKNNFEEGYFNGTLGKVVSFEGDHPVVETLSGKHIYVTLGKWKIEDDGVVLAQVEQFPLRLAWAITVHKSQGMNLDAAEIDLSKSFVPGQGYVALSRLRNVEGLTLLGLNSIALEVDPYVLELDKRLLRDSFRWARVIKKFTRSDFRKMHEDFILQNGGTINEDEIEKNINRKTAVFTKKIPTHEKTLKLVEEGKSLREIAKTRGMTVGTIITHLEKLKEKPYSLTLSQFKPKATDMKSVREAFKGSKDMKLAPAYRKLKGKYSYEKLRVARLFM